MKNTSLKGRSGLDARLHLPQLRKKDTGQAAEKCEMPTMPAAFAFEKTWKSYRLQEDVNMRVTCDVDNDSNIPLLWCIIKGIYKIGRLPDKVRATERGYHVIWKNLNMTEEESMKHRLFIGDDENRIKLDKGGNRIKQVLFSYKTSTTLGYVHPVWFRIIRMKSPNPHFTQCPECLKYVKEASKIWDVDKREIEVVHTDGTTCHFPLKQRKSLGLRLLKLSGVNIIT